MIAGLHVRDLRADGLDDAGRLVAEDGGHRVRVLALHEVEVGMAQSRGSGLHQHLVRTHRADLDVVDDQLAGDGFENGSFHGGDTNDSRRARSTATSLFSAPRTGNSRARDH